MSKWEIILSIVGSGGIGAIITALSTRRKIRAEEQSTNVRSILDVDQRLNDRLVRLEERIATLERENLELRQRELMLNHENTKLKDKVKALEEENEALKDENAILQDRVYELMGADA